MNETALQDDCSRCAALCCVAPAFDHSEMFALDKPAGLPCLHLDSGCCCSIHADREEKGFIGCVGYTCGGAGQRVIQEIFQGRSWQDDPSLLAPMTEAFRQMRLVHELLLLLKEAGRLPLSPQDRLLCGRLAAELSPAAGWTRSSLALFEDGPAPGRVRKFLRSLRRHVSPER